MYVNAKFEVQSFFVQVGEKINEGKKTFNPQNPSW